MMIVHVSGREAMEEIRWAQSRGLKVMRKPARNIIALTAEDMQGLDMEGGANTSARRRRATRQARWQYWEGSQRVCFRPFSSDHCPFRYDSPRASDPKGRTSFRWVPNGIPGVETRLPILFSEGVAKGRISLNRFVELTSTNHAKLYGLYPKKGSIGVGFDADIVLWDPNREKRSGRRSSSRRRLHPVGRI